MRFFSPQILSCIAFYNNRITTIPIQPVVWGSQNFEVYGAINH